RRRHTRCLSDWSSDVCSSDLLPTSIAYLVVGLVLGPHALGVLSDSGATRLLAELGVAFLLFTLGLEFSLPRMLAMRREVLGLGRSEERRVGKEVRGRAGAARS